MRLLIALFLLFASANALKILMYNPKSSKSHVGFVNSVADALIDAGHEVVMYMPNLDDEFGNATNHKRARIIERECDFLDHAKLGLLKTIQADAWKHDASIFTLMQSFQALGSFFHTSCMLQLRDEEILDQLRREKFDIGFSEFFDVCGFGIFHKIGLKKHILLYSSVLPTSHAAKFGIPATPSFVPELSGDSVPPFGFLQRLKSHFGYLVGSYAMDKVFIGQVADAFPKSGIKISVEEMLARSQLFFVNTDELVDFPRPISHKVVQIGGMGVKKTLARRGSLEKKYQEVFEKAKRGVIYISFGSVASSAKMPPHLKRAFLDAIAEFPDVTFLWKYEQPEDPIVQGIPNLVVGKWLPQKEILAQPKTLMFVSHGGMNSVVEATTSGVPVIGIPLFADQYRNALMVQGKGCGLKLDKTTLTKDTLVEAFRTIIDNPSYKQNAKELSRMIAAKPMDADERIARYTEFAAQFDVHTALDMSGRHLSTIQFYDLDVLATMVFVPLLVLFILYKLARLALRRLLKWLLVKSKAD